MKSYFTKKRKQSTWSSILASSLIILCLYMSSCGEDEPTGQSINQSFKDQELLSYLLDHYDLNGDGALSTEEAARVKELEIDYSITHLEGLEYLTSLEKLNITNGHIQHLDLSSFPLLKTLSIQGDSLQTISLPSNNSLETMTCYACPFLKTGEDFYRQFENISTLYCDSNFLRNVELDVFPKLHKLNYTGNVYFTISNNQMLDTLNLYHPTGTSKSLSIQKAVLTSLQTSNFRNIQIEDCPNLADYSANINAYESHTDFMDKVTIKDCPSLIKWETSFDVISIENCEQLSELSVFCTENSTIQIEQVNSLKKLTLRGDSYNIYSEDETFSIPNIPFENMPNLEYVTIKGNLTSMDLSKNTNLKEVYIENAGLRFLNVANLPKLEKVTCKNHRLNVLDVSNCVQLDTCILQEYHLPPRKDQFPIDKAPLTLQSAKFEGCKNLKYLDLGKSQIKSLDVSDTMLQILDIRDLGETPVGYSDRALKEIKLNPDLEELYCQENVIESLDLSQTNITKLDVSDNELQYLKLNTQITKLLCNKNRLSSLDLSNCTQLDTLNISINNLKELSLKDLSSLSFLETSQNPFEEIIIERCPNLKAVGLGSEQCTMVRLVDCISLEHLSLSSTNYTLENCPEIESLYLSYAAQNVLNMEEFPNLKTLYVQDCLAETILIENLSQLNTLYISDKKLQLLQTSNLPQLKQIEIRDSKELPTINLSDSPLLESMTLINLISLSSIDLSSYPQLNDFYCRGCDLFTTLDFTKNSLQLKADCRGNQFLQTIYANPNQNIIKDDFTNIEYIY